MNQPTEPDPEDVAWPFHPDRDAWANRGFNCWADAGPWIEAHVHPDDAAAFAGWAEPAETSVWVSGGMSREEAAEWRDRGFGAADATVWRRHAGPRESIVWRELHFSADEAAAWQVRGFEPGRAFMWRAVDCAPDQAATWSAAAVSAWQRQHSGQPSPDWVVHWFEEQHN